jgi:hypothetical protein
MVNKIMRVLFVLIASLVGFNALSQEKLKTVKLKTWEHGYTMTEFVEVVYFLSVPKGFKYYEDHKNHSKEFVLIYSDSSEIYLNDNQMLEVTRNSMNIKQRDRKTAFDTINYHGQQGDGKYWREYIVGEVIIGYLNVPSEKKDAYDRALATLKRRELKRMK